ncbi:MAG: YfcE family phosphodiesterase [Planctomycetota bacterium]
MRLGLLSDSHGQVATTRDAVAALRAAGAECLLHLGDVGSEEVIDELVGMPARVVFGNCDLDDAELGRYAQLVGVAVEHPCGTLDAQGLVVAFTHGHLSDVVARALATEPDYLLHGHTHVLRDDRIGATRVINPGALFRAARYTAAVLDTATDRLEVLEIPHTSHG